MNASTSYPGTPRHQALLRHIAATYQADPRVRALVVFGSLARGNWDAMSDLDLDVVITDGSVIDVLAEVRRLCASFAALGEQALVIVPAGVEAADVVLASLQELSIRYHPLATTSPNIVESAQLVCGSITIDQIRAAGNAQRHALSATPPDPIDQAVRLALAVDRELHRGYLWRALPLLDPLRTAIVAAWAQQDGGGRPYDVLQARAPAWLQTQLGSTLPEPSLASVQRALLGLIAIVEHAQFASSCPVSPAQHTVFEQIRYRQQRLRL